MDEIAVVVVVVLLQRIPWNISLGLFVLGMALSSSLETVYLGFSPWPFSNENGVWYGLVWYGVE